MNQSITPPRSRRSTFRPKAAFSHLLRRLRLIIHPRTSLRGADVPSSIPSMFDRSGSPPFEGGQSLPIPPALLREHLLGLARQLRPLLPGGCVLGADTLQVTGACPIDAGGVADIWKGVMGDRRVAIKSLRYSLSSDHTKTYERFRNEILACSRLVHPNIVPFIGVYSTPEHPFGLVFEYMEHRNISEYLRNNEDVERGPLLLDIARCVEYMHNQDIIHGNLKITNILVGACRRARVAGFGVASLQPATPGVDIDRFFHGTAPELVFLQNSGPADARPTKESDMYALGVLFWEILTGRAPFFNEGGVAGVYSMLVGRRPSRPEHPERSDRICEMIEGCWEVIPSRRRKIAEVIVVLSQINQ